MSGADSLLRRFRDLRTIVPLLISAFVLAVIVTHVRLDYRGSLRTITQANLLLFALAVVAFYSSFVIRAVRWQLLLGNTDESTHFRQLFRIILLASFANCVLPAKTGDFYRAYLLRRDSGISGSKGLGTVAGERVLDFLVLMSLLVSSGMVSFRMAIPHPFLGLFGIGLAIAFGVVAGLIVLRYTSGRVSQWLPDRFQERTRLFKRALLGAFQRRVGDLLALTVLVWAAESARLYLVIQTIPLHQGLTPAQVIFIALSASLLTTIPALPGGLLLVEGGIFTVLVFFGLSPAESLSVAILDRLISYWSLLVVGLFLFLLASRAGGWLPARVVPVRVRTDP